LVNKVSSPAKTKIETETKTIFIDIDEIYVRDTVGTTRLTAPTTETKKLANWLKLVRNVKFLAVVAKH
jgi:hypothetical protein